VKAKAPHGFIEGKKSPASRLSLFVPRSWLNHWNALAAKRAFRRVKGKHFDFLKGDARHAKIGFAVAPVDD
jgi:hypothetical protein